jgi:hypothetical protein
MAVITIIDDDERPRGEDVEVWLDTSVDVPNDGLCIGVGSSRRRAIDDAIVELEARIVDLKTLRAKEIDDARARIFRHVQ